MLNESPLGVTSLGASGAMASAVAGTVTAPTSAQASYVAGLNVTPVGVGGGIGPSDVMASAVAVRLPGLGSAATQTLSDEPGRAFYAHLTTIDGRYLAGTVPEPFDPAHWARYAVRAAELAPGTGQYGFDFPAVPAGDYGISVYRQYGPAPDPSDAPSVSEESIAWAGGVEVPSGVAGARDWDVLADIQARLLATRAYQGVFLSQPIGEGDSVVIAPWKFDELDQWDDPDDVAAVRHVQWQLVITVRRNDPAIRDREIDRLYGIAANTLDGKPLGGVCLPGLTKLRRGEWGKPAPPERQLVCYGEFAYFVVGSGGHGVIE